MGRTRNGDPVLTVGLRLPDLTPSRLRAFALGFVTSAVGLAGCGSPITPTPPVTPTPDPPKITCPAAQTIQSPSGNATTVAYGIATASLGSSPVTTACTPASGSEFSVGQTTVTCTATDALQRTDACTFVVTVTAPPQLAVTSFLAFGDSITWGEDGTNRLTATAQTSRIYPRVQLPLSVVYPSVLQQYLVSRYVTQRPAVVNAGLPGEVASDPATFARFTGLLSSGSYKVALIMEGSNDLYDRDSRIFPAAWRALQQMVRDAKSRGIRPYLATIPPMDPAGFRGLPWSMVAAFNDGVRDVARSEGVDLVDVYNGFGGNLALLSSDGLHPNANGYARIADLFFTAIKQTLEKPQPSSSATTSGTSLSSVPAASSRDVRRPAPRGR